MQLKLKKKTTQATKEILEFLKHLKQDLLTINILARELNLWENKNMEEQMQENQSQEERADKFLEAVKKQGAEADRFIEAEQDGYLVLEVSEELSNPFLDDKLNSALFPDEDFNLGFSI